MRTPTELVEYLRNLSKENGVSLTKLEEKFGWANGTIGKWVKNKKLPSHERLKMIADYFDKTVAEIIAEDGEEMKPVPPEESTRGMTPEEREAHYRGLHLSEQKEKPAEIGELSEDEIEYIKWFRTQATEKEKEIVRLIVKGNDEEAK